VVESKAAIAICSFHLIFEGQLIDFVSYCGGRIQGCQMVCFQTKNPELGKFWRVLLWKILVYFMTIWSMYFMAIGNISWPFGIFCSSLVYFSPFWYIGPRKIWQPWS
jgi:hypothetical protein